MLLISFVPLANQKAFVRVLRSRRYQWVWHSFPATAPSRA